MKTNYPIEFEKVDAAAGAAKAPLANRLGGLKRAGGELLALSGDDPSRAGLRDTPSRFGKAFGFLTTGYDTDTRALVGEAIFPEPSGELVLVRDIELYSLCEHHLLPFFGKAHVAYVPNGKVIGLSKIPRIVDAFARRLQVQERLGQQIAEELQKLLEPHGVAVVIEASHLCMMMRGVEKQGSTTVTKATTGSFAHDPALRAELLALLRR